MSTGRKIMSLEEWIFDDMSDAISRQNFSATYCVKHRVINQSVIGRYFKYRLPKECTSDAFVSFLSQRCQQIFEGNDSSYFEFLRSLKQRYRVEKHAAGKVLHRVYLPLSTDKKLSELLSTNKKGISALFEDFIEQKHKQHVAKKKGKAKAPESSSVHGKALERKNGES